MDDKMNVPDGMLSAAYEYCPASFAMPAVEAMLEAALKWLDGELKRHHNSNTNSWQAGYNVAIEDVRRMFRVTPEHKDGTVVWRAGTTIPIGVWSGGKIYTTNVPDPLKLCERDNDGASHISEKQKQDNDHQNDPVPQIVQHGFGGEVHQIAAVQEGNDFHPGW